jgi:hypothetical protein
MKRNKGGNIILLGQPWGSFKNNGKIDLMLWNYVFIQCIDMIKCVWKRFYKFQCDVGMLWCMVGKHRKWSLET